MGDIFFDAVEFGLKVTDLSIKGHGANNVITLNDNDFLSLDNLDHIFDQDNNDLTDLFREALSPTAGIELAGCQTGRGNNSIAQQLSSILPGRVVSGGQGLFQLSIPWSTLAIGKKNYFINGNLANSTW